MTHAIKIYIWKFGPIYITMECILMYWFFLLANWVFWIWNIEILNAPKSKTLSVMKWWVSGKVHTHGMGHSQKHWYSWARDIAQWLESCVPWETNEQENKKNQHTHTTAVIIQILYNIAFKLYVQARHDI